MTCLFLSVIWNDDWLTLLGGHMTMACLSGKDHGKNMWIFLLSYCKQQKNINVFLKLPWGKKRRIPKKILYHIKTSTNLKGIFSLSYLIGSNYANSHNITLHYISMQIPLPGRANDWLMIFWRISRRIDVASETCYYSALADQWNYLLKKVIQLCF